VKEKQEHGVRNFAIQPKYNVSAHLQTLT